jgi:chromosome segregation ATPase
MAEKRAGKASGETMAKPTPASTVDSEAASNDEVSQSSEQIEAEIEETREELGDSVAALADKADVKKQAQQRIEETKEAVQAKASATADAAKQKFQAAPETASEATDRTVAALRANPVPALAAVGGFLLVAAVVRRGRR